MRFIHTVIHEVSGIIGPDEGDIALSNDSDKGLSVYLTKNPDPHTLDSDQSLALSTMLLKGMAGQAQEGTFSERLDQETKRVREGRTYREQKGAFFVLRREGDTEGWEPTAKREEENVVVTIDGSPCAEIREASQPPFSALMLSVYIAHKHPIRIFRRHDTVVYYRSDGKKLFPIEFSVGGLLSVSTQFSDEAQQKAKDDFASLSSVKNMSKAIELLAQSLESPNDPIHAFLYGWAALEIFVEKAFQKYEHAFFSEANSEVIGKPDSQFVSRIRKVMSGKYGLSGKFALVADRLVPDEADADIKRFKSLKKSRDSLYHGEVDSGDSLPVDDVQRLLARYLEYYADFG